MKTIIVANLKGGVGKTNTAITLATALAAKGYKTVLADADNQKSSLKWLKIRPENAVKIDSYELKNVKKIDVPKSTDYLIIDSPGALETELAEELISECDVIVIPLQPSYFDVDSTKKFIKRIEDIKRIRKGKIEIHLLPNRVKPNDRTSKSVLELLSKIDQQPITWISERSAYAQLAMQGLNIFDKYQKIYVQMHIQWHPLLNAISEDKSSWF